jgi:hypothetical protein
MAAVVKSGVALLVAAVARFVPSVLLASALPLVGLDRMGVPR